MELAADSRRGLGQRVERNRIVFGIEKTVERSAAGLHSTSHVGLGELAVDHLLADLPGENALDGNGGGLLVDALFAEPVVEAAADVLLLH